MQLNQQEDLQVIRNEVISNLQDMLAKYGITARIPGAMRFDRDGDYVSFKVELVAGRTKEEKALDIAFKRDQITRTKADVPDMGECVLVGYNTRARKYPYLVRRVSDGKMFKLTTASVVRHFTGEK